MRLFGCAKFRRLSSEEVDRALTEGEFSFMAKHRVVCPSCASFESLSATALGMLRLATIEAEPTAHFDERVVRKLRVQVTRESIRYWSPAVVGAFIAGLAVIAALQMITRSADLPHVRLPGSEAKRIQLSRPAPFLPGGYDLPPLR